MKSDQLAPANSPEAISVFRALHDLAEVEKLIAAYAEEDEHQDDLLRLTSHRFVLVGCRIPDVLNMTRTVH